MFDTLLPYLLAGISVGGQYALIAVGYTLVYGILRLINFAHGDIFTAEDGVKKLQQSGVDGLLIGRGALGNPWIFAQLKAALQGGEVKLPDVGERVATALRHYDMLLSWKTERVAVNEMRKHIGWYIHGMRGAAQMRAKINTIESPDEARLALLEYAQACAREE